MKYFIAVLFLTGMCFGSATAQKTKGKSHDSADAARKKVLILAIDGGGIKGVVPAYFLSQLEAAFSRESKKIYQLFDVIGGTSTGGMISIGLTAPINEDKSPKSAQEILGFYLNDCDSIFFKNHQLFGPKYYAEYGLEPFLKYWLKPGNTLADAATSLPHARVRQVFTTSYVLNSNGGVITNPKMGVDYGPYLFNWYDAKKDPSQNYFLWEAVRGTSAAPVYYPIAHVGGGQGGRSGASEKWAVDGGLMSIDPAMWAVSESLRTGIASSLDDLIVISLGCGDDPVNGGLGITDEATNLMPHGEKYGFWGALDWEIDKLKNLAGQKTGRSVITATSVSSNQFVTESQLVSLSKGTRLQYYRVEVILPSNLEAMDDCGNAQALLQFAKDFFAKGTGRDQFLAIVDVIRRNQ